MDRYITGDTIKRIREARRMTQEELAGMIHVSAKAVSRWETGRGYPDISLLESLAGALGISVIELMSGEDVINTNGAANMAKGSLYVCPVCGNVIRSVGEALVSCCGITLPPLEAESCDDEHGILLERIEGEYFVRLTHPMTKEHFISFLCAVSDRGSQFVKLYPEEDASCFFRMEGVCDIYAFCNRHGLFRLKLSRRKT